MKERLILDQQPRLLIATQVVEVSLELDYDIMLTECATLDALVQRAGRVNRFRRPTPGRIIVFRHEEESYNIYPRRVLDASWELCCANQGALTERQLVALVEEAYSGQTLAGDSAFRNVQAKALALQQRLAGVLDSPRPWESENLTSRLETYPQVSVIPSQFAEEVRKIEPKDRRLFELKVPTWYAKKNKLRDDESEGLPLCRMEYDSTYGARLLADADHEEPGFQII
jgi:CRISPR-associated endonuclease/helicase Cas3